jgi:hypothetical protein
MKNRRFQDKKVFLIQKMEEGLSWVSIERDLLYAFLLRVISIVETILDFVSPSRGGISAVPIAILLTLRSLMNLFLAISATSTAVVIAWPLALRVISFSVPEERLVMIART